MKTKLTASVAGLFLGFALSAPASMFNLLSDGFESYSLGMLPLGMPTTDSNTAASLQGDPAMVTAAVTQGTDTVTPRTGSNMLQFLNTYTVNKNSGINGDMYYLFDLSDWATEIATGNASVSMTAYFNTGASGMHSDSNNPFYNKVDNAYFVGFSAWDSDLADFRTDARKSVNPHRLARLTNYYNPLISDRDESTWQELTISLDLPAATTYIAARVAAHENMYASASGADFLSSFADDISVTLKVPESGSSLLLLSFAAGGIIAARRKVLD